ncbi:MAG: acyl-phosphate glycerol 3-phosphate acyltransferase [Verrucomicrobiales bacterium]|nr:acyl-phosphate glycerol 3-phosphate acyltransferase [Verrucomicrobiales bacterium]
MSGFPEALQPWWLIPLGYVVGATPFGFMAGKMKGLDIRDHGSGNIGATNAMRILGKPIGYTILFLDILKGLLPVLLAKSLGDSSLIAIATAIAAIMGHNYTFWLGFKGGKGIATTAGAVVPILPIPILVALLTWIITLKLSRYVSVASIAAAIAIPTTVVVQSLIAGKWDLAVLGLALFVCLLAIWKHRANISRLRRGEEPRAEKKRKEPKPE